MSEANLQAASKATNTPVVHIAEAKEPMRLAEVALRILWTDSEGRLIIRRWRNRFYLWSERLGSYSEFDDDELRAQLYKLLDATVYRSRTRDGEPTTKPVKPSSVTVREVSQALVASTLVTGDAPQWLGNQSGDALEILAVSNGLLNTRTRALTPPTPEFFSIVSSPINYCADAPTPTRLLSFLQDLWRDDDEIKSALAEWFGYCLTPDTSQQKILLLPGPKRAGKGTIIRALSALVGSDNICAPTLSSLGTNFGLSPLLNRTVATITDARLSGRSDQAQITERLLAISGEDTQTIDRKHLSAVEARLRIRFVIVSNELPKLQDASGALASRFLVMPLTRSFYGKEDLGLEAAITSEMPGILNWALDGLDRLRSRGRFLQPQCALEAIRELEDLGSPVRAFVRERCLQSEVSQVSVKALFREWSSWAEESGLRAGDTPTFGRNLRAVVPSLQVEQPRKNGKRERVYRGIALVVGDCND